MGRRLATDPQLKQLETIYREHHRRVRWVLRARGVGDDALDDLVHDAFVVFVMAELLGMRVPEVAEVVDAPLDTLYSRLKLARRRFDERFGANSVAQLRRAGEGEAPGRDERRHAWMLLATELAPAAAPVATAGIGALAMKWLLAGSVAAVIAGGAVMAERGGTSPTEAAPTTPVPTSRADPGGIGEAPKAPAAQAALATQDRAPIAEPALPEPEPEPGASPPATPTAPRRGTTTAPPSPSPTPTPTTDDLAAIVEPLRDAQQQLG